MGGGMKGPADCWGSPSDGVLRAAGAYVPPLPRVARRGRTARARRLPALAGLLARWAESFARDSNTPARDADTVLPSLMAGFTFGSVQGPVPNCSWRSIFRTSRSISRQVSHST